MRVLNLVLTVLFQSVRALGRSRSDLILENLALRQQIAVLTRMKHGARFRASDRLVWVSLRRSWRRWQNALVIVKPETVVAWHRKAFRRYWTRISRRPGRPRLDSEARKIIARMAWENPTWGAPRSHGELLKLGFDISERTVSRYLLRGRPGRGVIHERVIFLRNHREAVAAMDFFTVPAVTFRVLYVGFVIHHDRRKVLHFNVTEHPTAPWVIQQLRESFPYDTAPSYLVFDRDAIFAGKVMETVRALGVKPRRTAYRSPWQNGVAERCIGSCRRELLDRVGGLHHRYVWRAAA